MAPAHFFALMASLGMGNVPTEPDSATYSLGQCISTVEVLTRAQDGIPQYLDYNARLGAGFERMVRQAEASGRSDQVRMMVIGMEKSLLQRINGVIDDPDGTAFNREIARLREVADECVADNRW